MDVETKQHAYHTDTFHAAGAAIMSFQPINAVHQHLCAFHTYSHDRTRHVEAHHFCKHQSPDFHQCIIYDSDKPDARLIGIEYIVSHKIFETLPAEEKRYWHSHKYEVESGLLQLQAKVGVPTVITDVAEQPAMPDIHPELPLGPPALMMAYTSDDQIPADVVTARDERLGMTTEAKRELRKGYLSPYERLEGADEWEKTGKAVLFVEEEREVKLSGPG